MLAKFHMCGIMLLLRAAWNMLPRNASERVSMCFRCLMFSLSGPCEFLFLLALGPELWCVLCYILIFYMLLY